MANTTVRLLVTFPTNNRSNDNTNNLSATTTKDEYLCQEEGKKSIFYLKDATITQTTTATTIEEKNNHICYCEIPSPASITIQCPDPSENKKQKCLPFVFGGIEILSNSRNIEVYVDKNDDTRKEEYIQTYRGIRDDDAVLVSPKDDCKIESNNNGEWYKTLIVQQPSPISITRLKLKFLSLRPAKIQQAIIRTLKITCRIPDEESVAIVKNDPNTQENSNDSCSNNPVQTSDIQGALGTMSGVIRMTEESMMNRISHELQSRKKSSDSMLQQNMVFVYKEIHELKQAVIIQNSIMKEQQNTIQKLAGQQEKLLKGHALILNEFTRWREKDEEKLSCCCCCKNNHHASNLNDVPSSGMNKHDITVVADGISKNMSFYAFLFPYLEFDIC